MNTSSTLLTETAKPSRWRYAAGVGWGLALSGLIVIVITVAIDPWVAKTIDRGEDGLLYATPVMWEFTVQDLYLFAIIATVVLSPLIGAMIQHKPLLPALSARRSFLLAIPAAIITLGAAWYIFLSYVLDWMWLYHN